MRRQEPTPEFEVEKCAPVGGPWTGRGGGRHDVECFAEVGRVFVKVHQRAVQRQVRFVYTVKRRLDWVGRGAGTRGGNLP